MVAAEARAAGLPLIAPDRGGVADHARGADSQLYEANSSASAAAAIRRFVDGDRAAARAITVAESMNVRTMDQHFVDLFAHYGALREDTKRDVA